MPTNELPCIGCDTQEGCGTGMGNWPKPGDPDNNSILSAKPAFGGVDVSWTYPLTNPFAVAHTILYRGYSSDFAGAAQLAVISGNFFYDKNYSEVPVRYYYWIQIVSVNGTYGEVIGPASAMPNPTIDDMLTLLTGKINAGLLAQSLKQEIDRIEINAQAIIDEVSDRFTANVALTEALALLQSGLDGAVTYIDTEITRRVEGDESLLERINTLGVGNEEMASLIIQETTARINADEAFASDIQTIFTKVDENEAGLITERTARTTADEAFASEQIVIKADVGLNKAAILQESSTRATADSAQVTSINNLAATVTSNNTALSGLITTERNARINADSALVTQINTVGAAAETNANQFATGIVQTETTARINGDNALASVVQTAQSEVNANIASIQTSLTTNINTVNGKVTAIGALYTAKVTVNGLVGGFGVYNDGSSVEAGFDVDTFWVGKTNANRKRPFIITGGVVYIDQAVVADLSVSRLKIMSYPFSAGSASMTGGTTGDITIQHWLGRNVLPVILWNGPPTPQTSITMTFEDANSFRFRMNAFELSGVGFTGTVYYQFMYV